MSVISKEGMAIAPGVVETIISLAVRDVEGVDHLGDAWSGILRMFQNKATVDGVEVNSADDGTIEVTLNLSLKSGYSLNAVVDKVRTAVYDAVLTQVGLKVSRVDITIDEVCFGDK